MRKFQKYKLLILVLLLGISVVAIGKYYSIWNAKKVVSAAIMKEYGETFLRRYEYEYLVMSKVLPADQNSFSFLKDKPFLIKATISNSNGAATEFIPSFKQKFQSRTVEGQIGQEIFSDKDLNIPRVEYHNGTIINYAGTSSAFIVRGKYNESQNFAITTLNGSFLEVLETGSVLTKGLIVNHIVYQNAIIIKGSNHRDDWSRKIAEEDTRCYLVMDFREACLNSEEFRKYLATPELTNIANKILTKNKDGKYGEVYGPLEYEKDIAELIAAADAHGINRDYAMKIYTLLKEKPSWWERHRIISYLTFLFLGPLLLWFVKLVWQKLKLSQILLVWWRNKFQHTQK